MLPYIQKEVAPIMQNRVPVINKHGRALMPCKPRTARKLLAQEKAKPIKKEPFTIQLLYGSTGYTQPQRK